eukprot:6180438-Pleurochrysis_carterae.AAC.2
MQVQKTTLESPCTRQRERGPPVPCARFSFHRSDGACRIDLVLLAASWLAERTSCRRAGAAEGDKAEIDKGADLLSAMHACARRLTPASEGHAKGNAKGNTNSPATQKGFPDAPDANGLWKMKKFENVKPRVN